MFYGLTLGWIAGMHTGNWTILNVFHMRIIFFTFDWCTADCLDMANITFQTAPDQQTVKTLSFIGLVTVTEDYLINCTWLAGPGCYLFSEFLTYLDIYNLQLHFGLVDLKWMIILCVVKKKKKVKQKNELILFCCREMPSFVVRTNSGQLIAALLWCDTAW